MMFDDNPGAVALITGAGSGIGAATARLLAAEGVHGLVLMEWNADSLARIREEVGLPDDRLLCLAQDVADPKAWDEAAAQIAAKFGRLDYAVANAGIPAGGPLVKCSFEEWRRVIAVNLDGVFLTLKTGLKMIGEGGRGGAMVVIASVAAIKAEQGAGPYAAAKAGAVQLSKVAAREGARDQIRVNVVLPGGVKTPIWNGLPFFDSLSDKMGGNEAAFDAMAKGGTPLGRFAAPEELANQIGHLLSSRSQPMTGASVVVDGGLSA